MINDLYLTQVALEKESRSMTIQRFESDLTDKKQDRQEASTFYGKPLMKRAIEPMALKIILISIYLRLPSAIQHQILGCRLFHQSQKNYSQRW